MAEVKATRRKGVSGAQNALAQPFRRNGLAANRIELALRGVPAKHTGTHKVQGAIGGLLAAQLGYGFTPTEKLAQLVDRSLELAPTAAAVLEAIEPVIVTAEAA